MVREAYQRGYADGSAAMRDSILKAASAPLSPQTIKPDLVRRPEESKTRAPRGSVRGLVQRVLTETPGLRTGEIGERVAGLDPRVSPSSASNELRRFEGQFYRKEGDTWFLIGHADRESAEEPREAASADVLTFAERG